jgi:hypothetical protein
MPNTSFRDAVLDIERQQINEAMNAMRLGESRREFVLAHHRRRPDNLGRILAARSPSLYRRRDGRPAAGIADRPGPMRQSPPRRPRLDPGPLRFERERPRRLAIGEAAGRS